MQIVLVDDERTFAGLSPGDVILRNSDSALLFFTKLHIEQQMRYGDELFAIYLDHDLGNDDDIRIVVDFLVLCPILTSHVFVHSQNPTTDWIVQTLFKAGYNAERVALPGLA